MAFRFPRPFISRRDRFWAATAYLGPLCAVPLLREKDNDFVQFHARQGCVVLAGWVLVVFLLMMPLLNIVVAIPLAVAMLAINVLAIIRAAHGHRWEIPHIHHHRGLFGL